jgi:hypothetical protein
VPRKWIVRVSAEISDSNRKLDNVLKVRNID